MVRNSGTERIETSRPVRAQMNLDTGRIDAREAVALFGVTVVGLAVSTVGWLLVWVATPAANGGTFIVLVFGGSVGVMGLALAWVVWRLAVRSWDSHEKRLQDWHDVCIEAHEVNQGLERTRTVRQWDLCVDEFQHVLLVALAVHRRVQGGERTPWSVRNLGGAVWLGSRRLGDVPTGDAERMRQRLVDLGLVTGAGERKAGAWAPVTADEVIDRVKGGWKW